MCMEQNEIGFITVAICGGYIGKYPRLIQNIYSQTIYQHLFDSMFAKLWINPKCNETSFNHVIFLIKVT